MYVRSWLQQTQFLLKIKNYQFSKMFVYNILNSKLIDSIIIGLLKKKSFVFD